MSERLTPEREADLIAEIDRLREDNKALREALEYYAGQGNDRGYIARAALERTR